MSRFVIELTTETEGQIIDLTRDIARQVAELEGVGVLHLFVVGSTAGITTIEYEPGLVRHDFQQMMEQIAPADGRYDHEATWNDDNGHSHLRASMIGPSLMVPYGNGKLVLGHWQQIVLCEFDTRPRQRTIVGTILPAAGGVEKHVEVRGSGRSSMLAL